MKSLKIKDLITIAIFNAIYIYMLIVSLTGLMPVHIYCCRAA